MGPLVETKSRTCAATFCPLHQTSFNMAEEDLRPVEVKLFGKWSYEEIEVKDISLEDYIAVKTKSAVFVPHTAGRYQKKRFRKAQCPIIERLTCSLMMHGQQRQEAHGCPHLSHAFEIIHLLTDQNPLQVAVDAIINSGPREDATRIGSAGVVRRQAVDISPLRRVNQAIWLITTGAREAAFRNVKTIAEWEAPMISNPDYKGEWHPKMIDNPDYKGIWEAPDIPNPEFEDDPLLYKYDDLKYVGFELWQVKAGTIFDNIFVSDSVEEAEKFRDETWGALKEAENAMFDKSEEEEEEEEEEDDEYDVDDGHDEL